MKKLKNKSPILVMNEKMEDFFARGLTSAKLFDKKKKVASRRIISFEDPQDLVNFITSSKLKLVATIRKHPDSVTGLAKALNRSRAAIHKDIQQLESIGIVKSKYITNPGHGKHKIITIADKMPIQLQVQAVI